MPVLCIGDLSAAERKAYALADNKIALNAGWDQELLAIELRELIELDFEVELTGFSLAEIDLTIDTACDASPEGVYGIADRIPPMEQEVVTRPGDLWLIGRHRLLCGDARRRHDYALLMDNRQGGVVFTDPPYNVPIDGHVCGLGRIRHREFAMGAGEMSQGQFTDFLGAALGHISAHLRAGAILYACMDWRHMRELAAAGEIVGLELKNLEKEADALDLPFHCHRPGKHKHLPTWTLEELGISSMLASPPL